MSLETHKSAEGVNFDDARRMLDHRVAEGHADVGIKEESEVDLTGIKKIDEAHIKKLYRNTLSKLEQEEEFTVTAPEISFMDGSNVRELRDLEGFQQLNQGVLDTENYELILPEREKVVRNVSIEQQKAEMNLNSLFEFRFSQLTDDSLQKLADVYDTSANVLDTRASSLDGSTGVYKDRSNPLSNQQVIEFDYAILNFMDLETGKVRDNPKTPPSKKEEDMRYMSVSPDDISDHEVMHAIHFQNNPHVIDYSQRIGTDVAGDEENDYKRDLRRATIEAITTFEQELNHDESRGLDSDFNDPFLVGEVLSMKSSPNEEFLYNNPYDLGKVAAFTVDAALREEHGEEKGRELAREYLMDFVTTPRGLEGAIERGLDMMDLPDIHENMRSYYDRLADAENPDQELFEIGMDIYLEFGEGGLDTEEAIDAHYRLNAAEAAYREVNSLGLTEEYNNITKSVKHNISSERFT